MDSGFFVQCLLQEGDILFVTTGPNQSHDFHMTHDINHMTVVLI